MDIQKVYDAIVKEIPGIYDSEGKLYEDWIDTIITAIKPYLQQAIPPESESLVKAKAEYQKATSEAVTKTSNNITPWYYVEQLTIKQNSYIRELEARVKQLEGK